MEQTPHLEIAEPLVNLETTSEPAVDVTESSVKGRPVLFGLAWLGALLSLFAPLARSGIWDPYELEVAEFSRRIAVNLMNAPGLALAGLENRVPILRELGRGQLPFSSVALGFKVFGLHDWSGRLPLALWGLLGIIATYVLVRRLLDRAAAPFAVLMLASCPLYFLQARTMLGDIVSMAALAIACTGFGLALFDDRLKQGSRGWWAAVFIGALGVVSGFGCRGVFFGVALPTLSVAAVALVQAPLNPGQWRTARGFLAFSCAAVGMGALYLGLRALLNASADDYSMILGSEVAHLRKLPTHDSVLHALGHGMLPWSALIPFALGTVVHTPPLADALQWKRESALRSLVLVVGALALLAHGLLAPLIGELPFSGVFAFACAVAILARDLERGHRASLATGVGALAMLVLLVVDFRQFPEKGFSAFVVGDVKMPASFTDLGKRYLEFGALAAVLGCFVGFWEKDVTVLPRNPGTRFWQFSYWRSQFKLEIEDYKGWPKLLEAALHGNPLYTVVPVELLLIVAAVDTHLQRFHLLPQTWVARVPKPVLTYGWAGFLGLLLIPTLMVFARDMVRFALRFVPTSRATIAVLAFAGFGFALSLGYYPALAAQISPRDVFEAYRRSAVGGDELGLIGASSGAAAYYTGNNTQVFDTVNKAGEWLLAGGAKRRYLVVNSPDLARLNAEYRSKISPPHNVPVIDARSSEILLVSNRLGSGPNQNPLNSIVLEQRPSPAHSAVCSFEDQIDCLGWEVATKDGKPVDVLSTGVPYLLRFYFQVHAKVTGSWKTFVHLDGTERINLDHDTAQGKYPFNLWSPGDYILDEYEFTVPRGQVVGKYGVYFGLFEGSQRKNVTKGNQTDNRVNLGDIEVR
ncbi:MAG TPA: glycosyltransferase family 39 protein [Polyangiaceae bacterium]|nr:glycosyltransferase family 39 protein [Polyangiaceae bacterium]